MQIFITLNYESRMSNHLEEGTYPNDKKRPCTKLSRFWTDKILYLRMINFTDRALLEFMYQEF